MTKTTVVKTNDPENASITLVVSGPVEKNKIENP
jgi:hypothetical protein